MKLRNKKTGEIVDTLCSDDITKGISFGIDHHDGNPTMAYYNSLAELNSEWEDVAEEPKKYWFINASGEVYSFNEEYEDKEETEASKTIGNHFETKEEAELAVRKLEAWKRLKDTGFEFTGWDRHPDYPGDYRITASDEWTCDDQDLDLLFGGEE